MCGAAPYSRPQVKLADISWLQRASLISLRGFVGIYWLTYSLNITPEGSHNPKMGQNYWRSWINSRNMGTWHITTTTELTTYRCEAIFTTYKEIQTPLRLSKHNMLVMHTKAQRTRLQSADKNAWHYSGSAFLSHLSTQSSENKTNQQTKMHKTPVLYKTISMLRRNKQGSRVFGQKQLPDFKCFPDQKHSESPPLRPLNSCVTFPYFPFHSCNT